MKKVIPPRGRGFSPAKMTSWAVDFLSEPICSEFLHSTGLTQNEIHFTAKTPKRQSFAEFAKCAWRLDTHPGVL
ncbi:MAG: hypothetical protein ABWK53_06325, partial [Anaerolineales bacterium]